MQEVTSIKESVGTSFDQLRTSALVDVSSQSRAFSDFMGLVSKSNTGSSLGTLLDTTSSSNHGSGTTGSTQNLFPQINSATATPAAQPLVQSDTASTLATTVSAATTTATASTRVTTSTDSSLDAAKNSAVSREAFEQAKPLLAKAGLTDAEMTDLSARVQAGTLTWGQLVKTLGSHTAGSKKAVALSDTEKADLQTMFQKLGFGAEASSQMVASVAKGDGLSVLSTIQNKLSGTDADSSFGLDADELSTFFKALQLPTATASALTQKLSGEATAADLKSALATIGQTMQDQRTAAAASDTELAKSLAKIMEKDVAKSSRDSSSTTTASGTSSGGQVKYDLKTKDKNDTSWFDQHEKNQQQSSDDAWKNFLSKVHSTDTAAQQAATGVATGTTTGSAGALASAGKDALDNALSRSAQALSATQQAKTETSAQSAPFTKVTAPKVLDQVSEALLKDLGQGRKQLTIDLDPESLGKVQVMLQVKGKEVNAVIRAEDADTAAMLSSSMDSLRKTLEDKGLTVENMEVQTGLASRQDQQAAFNAEQHNQAQEQQQDMSRILSQLRMMRSDSSDMALDMQDSNMRAILADQGLHLIA